MQLLNLMADRALHMIIVTILFYDIIMVVTIITLLFTEEGICQICFLC